MKMTLITLPNNRDRRLVFYLAMEEYISSIAKEEYLFLWQVSPTVIFGRHQVFANEVNIAYCEANGIQMYRRKSGGGCVYSDWGNLMISYITPDRNVSDVFSRYMEMLKEVLKSLGFDAARTENNDILIEKRKVSGNAFYLKPCSCIAHGTMLYDTNMEDLVNAISPSKEKIQKHGIQSVRQRVINLKELGLDSIESLKTAFRNLCDHTITLTEEHISEIEQIELTYLDKQFITKP